MLRMKPGKLGIKEKEKMFWRHTVGAKAPRYMRELSMRNAARGGWCTLREQGW